MRELSLDGMYRVDYASMAAWADRALAASRPLGDRRWRRPRRHSRSPWSSPARCPGTAQPREAAALVDALPTPSSPRA